MVLVDTSVWIRFLGNRAPYAIELDRLLGLDEVTGHELVYGELLIGDRGGRRKLLAAYEQMHQASLLPTATSLRSFAIATCMGAASAGSTFTYSRPLLRGDCGCGQPIHGSPL
jgi:predicted nucleic acid-binding protein